MMRRIEYILGVAALSLALGSLAWLDKTPSGRSLPMEPMAAVPVWITSGSCVPMNAEERAQARLALQVLAKFPIIHVMHIAAVKYFERDHYRRKGDGPVLVCAPEALYPRIAELMLARSVFSRGYLHANELRLATALGPSDQRIVEAVARTAFHSFAFETEYPEARSESAPSRARPGRVRRGRRTLGRDRIPGDFGRGCAGYRRGAARGRGRHPQALDRVRELFADVLAAYPDDPIPLEVGDRLYELAYAIAMGGRAARTRAGPIYELLGRKVESWARPHAQDRRLVQIHTRAGDLWRECFVSEGGIELEDPRLRIEVADLFAATGLAA